MELGLLFIDISCCPEKTSQRLEEESQRLEEEFQRPEEASLRDLNRHVRDMKRPEEASQWCEQEEVRCINQRS